MSFRFNFQSSESDLDLNNESNSQIANNEQISQVPRLCKFISIDDLNLQVENDKVKHIAYGEHKIKYISQEYLANDNISLKLLNKLESDLLPGKYEGGLKVWECSSDLAHFLAKTKGIHPSHSVLELGCGVGLPGILCYLQGACVTFQDYNSEVLELITAPNVILNTPNEDIPNVSKRCQFLCGDWGEIQEKFYSDELQNKLFDVIITSETIYNKSAQRKLLNIMKSVLKPGGLVYLASKVHYFGVGGGIADFEDLLKLDASFEFSTIFKSNEGVERRILKLTFKEKQELS